MRSCVRGRALALALLLLLPGPAPASDELPPAAETVAVLTTEGPAAEGMLSALRAALAPGERLRVLRGGPADLEAAVGYGVAALPPPGRPRRVVVVTEQARLGVDLRATGAALRAQGIALTLHGLGPQGTTTLLWAPTEAAGPAALGTALRWERSPDAAFARAAAEDRLVLLLQLSGTFANEPET